MPVKSVSELIAYLKERPGKLNFGSSGRATSDRLAAEMFMLETGTRMLNVPYRGGGVALNDMLAGTTHVMFPQLPAVIGHGAGRRGEAAWRSPAATGSGSCRTCRH